jgi:SAM-dependent methyltransferase
MTDHTAALSFGVAPAVTTGFVPTIRKGDRLGDRRTAPPLSSTLGAGTGILTARRRGAPRRTCGTGRGDAGATGGCHARDAALAGTAEAVPLPAAHADAVLAGTAYHWFDRERAHPELARLVRPGGTFAAIWNLRDESVDWVARLGDAAGAMPGYRGIRDELPDITTFGDGFMVPERREFPHRVSYTPERLLGMIRTRSHYLTAGEERRRQLDRALHDLDHRPP